MPTFAGFWRGLDIADRVHDGLLRPHDAEGEERSRREIREALVRTLRRDGALATDDPSEREVLEATLVWLGRSDARFVVVGLEDLWSELRPVNVPGITSRPNWRGRAALTLEELRRDEDVIAILRALGRARGTRDSEEDAA
jgi:4-alpha-glucanotransferase